ncbi:MAG: aminoacyl-tRNA hydrolase [Lentisphaeria bacterium]|nr:aminoacyl-tRNA hydrolase [Lentisphaeria bacterium]
MALRNESGIKLIVGLGNPGREYENTRHNAGFMTVEELLKVMPEGAFTETRTAESRVFTGRFRGKNLMMQMPLTYMNSSGDAVGNLSRRLNIAPEEIMVISDDLDLPVGRIRLRRGGSDGGHNGLKSIIAGLGSANFMRLRIGIGRPEPGKTIDYVLTGFSGNELTQFQESIATAVEAVRCTLSAGLANAMNRYNAARVEPEAVKTETKQEN